VPKYLLEARYSHEGLHGLIHDKASGRAAAVKKAIESVGGKMENIYYAFGDHDVIVVLDLPDNVSAASLGIKVGSTGMVQTKTTPLLTVEEVDQAIARNVAYQAPGKAGK
jgi:uncharacterized protein with GYD domain